MGFVLPLFSIEFFITIQFLMNRFGIRLSQACVDSFARRWKMILHHSFVGVHRNLLIVLFYNFESYINKLIPNTHLIIFVILPSHSNHHIYSSYSNQPAIK